MAPPERMSLTRSLVQAMIAVIGGNAIYFLLVWRHLPANARHVVYRIDLGLVVDFWLCVACFGFVKLIWSFKKQR